MPFGHWRWRDRHLGDYTYRVMLAKTPCTSVTSKHLNFIEFIKETRKKAEISFLRNHNVFKKVKRAQKFPSNPFKLISPVLFAELDYIYIYIYIGDTLYASHKLYCLITRRTPPVIVCKLVKLNRKLELYYLSLSRIEKIFSIARNIINTIRQARFVLLLIGKLTHFFSKHVVLIEKCH